MRWHRSTTHSLRWLNWWAGVCTPACFDVRRGGGEVGDMSLYCASMLEERGSNATASRRKDAMAPLHHALADPRGPTLWRVRRCVRRGQELSDSIDITSPQCTFFLMFDVWALGESISSHRSPARLPSRLLGFVPSFDLRRGSPRRPSFPGLLALLFLRWLLRVLSSPFQFLPFYFLFLNVLCSFHR